MIITETSQTKVIIGNVMIIIVLIPLWVWVVLIVNSLQCTTVHVDWHTVWCGNKLQVNAEINMCKRQVTVHGSLSHCYNHFLSMSRHNQCQLVQGRFSTHIHRRRLTFPRSNNSPTWALVDCNCRTGYRRKWLLLEQSNWKGNTINQLLIYPLCRRYAVHILCTGTNIYQKRGIRF